MGTKISRNSEEFKKVLDSMTEMVLLEGWGFISTIEDLRDAASNMKWFTMEKYEDGYIIRGNSGAWVVR